MSFLPRATALFACSVLLAQEVFAEGVEFNTDCHLRYASGGVAAQHPEGLLKDVRVKCSGIKRGVSLYPDCKVEVSDESIPLGELSRPGVVWLTESQRSGLEGAPLPEQGDVIGLSFEDEVSEEDNLTPACEQDSKTRKTRCSFETFSRHRVALFYQPTQQSSPRSIPVGQVTDDTHFFEQVELTPSNPESTRSFSKFDTYVLDDRDYPLGLGLIKINSRLDCKLSFKLLN